MRKSKAEIRQVVPDSVYNNKIITKFINGLMLDGKKSLAEKIFYTALKKVEEKTKQPALDIFLQAIEKVKPVVEVKSRRIGGATYQVPFEVRKTRSQSLAIKWLVKFARERKEYEMIDRLTNEIIDASRSEGNTFKKKEEVHKIAESNKAFAHYKW